MRRLTVPLLTMVAILSGGTIASQAQTQPLLTRHVRQVTLNGQAPLVGHLPPTQSMRLVLVLPPRNQAELDDLLKELYDPQSASYRKFLTVEEFTARFGPSQEDYDAVIRFAEANGFAVIGTSPNRMNLDISGSVANVEAAFHLTMGIYQHPTENRTFFAPDREPTPPVQLWHVSGLDNYSTPRPGVVRRDASVGTEELNAPTGSGPDNSFLGSDMRAAYYGGSTLTGKGQSVGLFELRGTDLADLAAYYANVGQADLVTISDHVTLLSVDTQSTSCRFINGCDDTQQTVDLTQALGMAPDVSKLVMYIGTGGLTGQTVDDAGIFNAMATAKPLNAQLSNSWHWEPPDPTVDDPYFKEFAAQGQNFFQAAGDNGRWSPSSEAWPEDSPYVTLVGGTVLKTTRAGGAWSSETAWSDGGGGISPDLYPIPSWQVATAEGCVDCSKTYRNGPDISANAAPSYYVCADQKPCTANLYDGTGFSTPLWAALMALVNEESRSDGATSTLGFINPPLYTIGLGSNKGVFHDIIKGSNGFSATKGYDLATGWGSPNGSNLINALGGKPTPDFSIFASPASVSVPPGGTGTSTITTDITGGFNFSIDLSATGAPKGATTIFEPKSIAAPGLGTSLWTLTVPSTTAAGAYALTVIGTGGGLTRSTTFNLAVTAAPGFTISASPNLVSVLPGETGTSTITTAITGGFDSSVDLWATGQPKGVITTFNPKFISAPGSGTSTWTLAVPSTTPAGTYPLTVIGTGGGKNIKTTVTLAVGDTPNFAFSLSPTLIEVPRGGSGTSTLWTTTLGHFDSSINFTAKSRPKGVTVNFDPDPLKKPGSGKSTVTVKVGSAAALGAHTITITGTGGGITHTRTLGLKIVP